MTELPPGYWIDERTGAWSSIPWPTDHDEKRYVIENSIGPLVIRWAENRLTDDEFEQFGPGLIHPLTGESFEFTAGQKRALILYYAYDPETGEWLWTRTNSWFAEVKRDRVAAAAIENIEKFGPAQLAWDDDLGWHGVRKRFGADEMFTAEAKKWHGVGRGK